VLFNIIDTYLRDAKTRQAYASWALEWQHRKRKRTHMLTYAPEGGEPKQKVI
jgi:hypothetical protein